jgi:A/G-specific adenine glycosylase
LGYYSRARNLRHCARRIVAEHGGQIPSDAASLLALPGIGKYTAGAIASIAFEKREPILDGNVARVLCRLKGIRGPAHDPTIRRTLWQIAAQILPRKRVGDFNSALMELGALVCTPRQPNCAACPLRAWCQARAGNCAEMIPPPRAPRPLPLIRRWTFVICQRRRWLIERRPPTGRWAGLWQFITVPAMRARPSESAVSSATGIEVANVSPLGRIKHALSHRRYEFTAFTCLAAGDGRGQAPSRKWATLSELDRYPMSRPQLRIAAMLRESL